ncbi:rRNA adenine N-6-methyltransferase family protein [Streptomyces melanogenes]|uniref:rRNA adenine N-6-methyltransferase family protein n=1 Tax=Streptomyces melanogenes TaxID=67326 RepID=UPI0037A54A88
MVEAVERDLFLGPALYRLDYTRWEPVRRAAVSQQLAYADRTWAIQFDGLNAEDAPGPVTGSPTSSATLPSPVVRTLHAVGLRGGEKVLEIGTGTGYSTAILCHRLGDDYVISIEYDTSLAATAATHLTAAGYAPTSVRSTRTCCSRSNWRSS